MKKNNLKKNYIFNLSYQILCLLIPLITTPYISRVLGVEKIGIYSFTNSIVAYFVLFAGNGTTVFGQREIAYTQDRRDKRSEIFINIFLFRLIFTLLSFLVFCFFIQPFNQTKILWIQSIQILSVAVDISWFFQGMEYFQSLVLKNVFVKLAGVVCIFLLVKSPDDLSLYIFIHVFSVFLGNCSMWYQLSESVEINRYIKIAPLKNFKIILELFIPQIAIQIYTVLDKTMIGFITEKSAENGYYEQAYKIISICLTLVTSLGTVMIPRIAVSYAKEDTDAILKHLYTSYRFVWFIGTPVVFGIWATAGSFVPWFMGKGYEKVSIILIILTLLIFSIGINNVTGIQYLMSTKQQKIFTKSVVIGASINFILNLILIQRWGAIGAAIASVTAETFIALIQIIYVRKVINWRKILIFAPTYILAGFIMLILLLLENRFLKENCFQILLQVLSGFIFYIVLLVLFKDEIVLNNLKRFKHILKKV